MLGVFRLTDERHNSFTFWERECLVGLLVEPLEARRWDPRVPRRSVRSALARRTAGTPLEL